MRDAETSRIMVTGWRGNRTWAKGQKRGKTQTCTEVQAEIGMEAGCVSTVGERASHHGMARGTNQARLQR